MSEPFEVRKIVYRHNCGDIGFMYDVEVYYPARFYSGCYQMLGRDEMDVYNQIRERHNNVSCSKDREVDEPTTQPTELEGDVQNG